MSFWRNCYTAASGGTTPEERKVFKMQFLLLFGISTLLYLGYLGTREWHRIAEESHVQTIIHGWDSLAWYLWLATAPFMLLLIRRYPLARGRIRQSLGGILLGGVGLYLVVAHLRYFLRVFPDLWWGSNQEWLRDLHTYAYNTFAMLPLDFLTCCGFFAVSFSVDYYFKNRQRTEIRVQLQLRAAQLKVDLTRAELAALRSQMHPHFLFNSFNAIATLVRQRKNEAAVEVIAQLSALLRLAIDRTGLEEIPLHQELDFIRRYLEIEHVRFGDKLRVDFAVEPASLDALVPNIVLQPLVENAIKHGISLRTSPGTIRVTAARAGSRLRIDIADDGPDEPFPGNRITGSNRPGIGLANTRAQLDNLYGADYQLEMLKQPEGGTVVSLDLPLHLVPAAKTS
jgi:two-component system LytT family sensor kinase